MHFEEIWVYIQSTGTLIMVVINQFHSILLFIQHSISFCGVLVIFLGVLVALYRYFSFVFFRTDKSQELDINEIRLKLGRVLTLGLEFIVAADLIGTTTAPDYYSVGIVACIVLIRTLLSYTLNHEINALSQQQADRAKT